MAYQRLARDMEGMWIAGVGLEVVFEGRADVSWGGTDDGAKHGQVA